MRRRRTSSRCRPQTRDLAAEYGEDDANAYMDQARKTAKVQKNIELFDQQ